MNDDLLDLFLDRFVDVARARVGRVLSWASSAEAPPASVSRVELHTLAGEASMLGLDRITAAALQATSAVRAWEAGPDSETLSRRDTAIRSLDEAVAGLSARCAPAPDSDDPARVGDRGPR